MKVIEIMKLSAEMLGLNQIHKTLIEATEETESEVLAQDEIAKMLSLFELSVQELCTNYISVYVEEEIEISGNKFALSQLNNFVKVVSVSNENGLIKHKIINRNLVVESDGKYVVKYCTYPTIKTLFADIDFLTEFSPDVLVLGLCSYFTVAMGMFKEFEIFHEQYLEKANTFKNLRLFELPLRRWEWFLKRN